MLGVGGEAQTQIAPVVITVGPIARSLNLLVQDDAVLRANQGASAIVGQPLLGQNFFHDLAVEIDETTHRIAFMAPQTKSVPGDASIPFRREGNLVIVKPKIMGRECEMILDTGASSLAFTDRQFSGFGFNRPTNANSATSTGVGGNRSSYMFFVDKVELGPVAREGVKASLDLNGTMTYPLLGAPFLDGLHFIIEPKLKQVIFVK
jgi:clan AA aspartic protease (TIGR02281 family)